MTDANYSGRVLIIAGSDSSGGAGIQADIKTVTMLGGYAATAITALTVQNTVGVTAVHSTPQDIIKGQIEAVLGDIGADAIKTGMLGDTETINTVVEAIKGTKAPLVVDPVMVATSGDRLLNADAVDALKTKLLPLATVVTPNIPEAEVLTGLSIKTKDDMREAGTMILDMGAKKAVVVKGGHMDGSVMTDMLITADNIHEINASRIDSTSTHGTGCTFASAMACILARGATLDQAYEVAHEYVRMTIEAAPGFGAGHGPLGHAHVRIEG